MRTTLFLLLALAAPATALAGAGDCYAPGNSTWQRQRCEINRHEAQENEVKFGTCEFYEFSNDREGCERRLDRAAQRESGVTVYLPAPVIQRRPSDR